MKRNFICVILLALCIGLIGCRDKQASSAPPPVEAKQTAPNTSTPGAASPRRNDSPQDSARQELLKQKGELLMEQKRVRASQTMTPAQKDSALRAIENESIQLSKKLLDASK